MNITKQNFVDKVKSIHPDIVEDELFVENKELSIKGFAMLLAHFDNSNIRTKNSYTSWHKIDSNKRWLTKQIMQKMDYITMFFIKDDTIFITGPIHEISKLTNQSIADFISKIPAFEEFNVAVIDNMLPKVKYNEKDIYVVPSRDKPYASYTAGMAKRQARKLNSQVLIVKVSDCERLEKTNYDIKLTNIGRILSSVFWNTIKDDAPNGLYCSFSVEEKDLSTAQHCEIIETMFDEILIPDLASIKGKVTLRLYTGFETNFEYVVQYNKKGKKIIMERK